MLNRFKKNKKAGKQDGSQPDPRDRVAEAAYFLAERRGFEPGRELDDWVAAENMVAADSAQDIQPS